MDSIESLERRARGSYERTRVMRSVVALTPMLIVGSAATLISRRPESAMAFGAVLFVVAVALVWRGKPFNRAVLAGIVAGLVPLTLALAANRGHLCISGHCSTWCVPACVTGGIVAGFAVSFLAKRRGYGNAFWVSASAVSLLTGAMGCSCAGYSGVLGLLGGFVVATLPWLPLSRRGEGRGEGK